MAMQKKGSTTTRASAKRASPAARRTPATKRAPKGAHPDDVVAALQAEHRYAARLLDLLEEQQAALAHGRPIDCGPSVAAMMYMTGHNDAYHHPREDAMFVQLAKREPRLASRIARIEREHKTIGAAGKHLLAALQRLQARAGAKEADVAALIGAYVGAMREHMTMEERDLLPRARQLLDEGDLAKIDGDFRRVVDPLFEASVREAYAEYPPVVRYLTEQPALRRALGVLDAFYESALTLGDVLFAGETEEQRRRESVSSTP